MDLRSLIGARPPYFALGELHTTANAVETEVSVEQELGREQGPISAAEVVRHLTTLGSCALARVNPRHERHYYLATSAELERLAPGCEAPDASLRAQAFGWFVASRAGRARCTLFSENCPLYSLDVSYTVLGASTFQRLFSNARRDSRTPPGSNPHARRPALAALELSGRRASCVLPPLESRLCAGHFEDYPMLPVAVVMSSLSDLAGELLFREIDDSLPTYVVQSARVKAHQFALPPEQLVLEAEYAGSSPDRGHVFLCRASALGGKGIGEMSVVLAPDALAHRAVQAGWLSAS